MEFETSCYDILNIQPKTLQSVAMLINDSSRPHCRQERHSHARMIWKPNTFTILPLGIRRYWYSSLSWSCLVVMLTDSSDRKNWPLPVKVFLVCRMFNYTFCLLIQYNNQTRWSPCACLSDEALNTSRLINSTNSSG